MDTARLHIRRFRPEDLDDLFALLSDGAVMEHLEPPYTRERAGEFLEQCALSEPPPVWAVEDRQGDFVGYVIYHPYDDDAYEIGWVLRRDRWGQGYAGELTRRLIQDARGRTRRLVIECAPAQQSTARIARKHGFSFAGHQDGLDLYLLTV